MATRGVINYRHHCLENGYYCLRGGLLKMNTFRLIGGYGKCACTFIYGDPQPKQS
jgi:hypothetical protein